MKRKLVLIAMAVMMVSFSGFAKSAKKQAKEAKINFKTEKNGKLECTNISSSDLILFAGKIERNFILGGIKSGETRLFDLSKISEMPEQGAFIMRTVPYETYKTKEKLNNDDVVYTKLVVYDLKDEKKIKIVVPNLIDVSRKFGFYADNDSPFVVELHGDIPDGEVIAALAPFETNKYIFLKPRSDGLSYDFYPTWVYVNPRTNENTTISSGINDKRHAYPEAIDEKKYRVYGLNALLNQTLNTTLNVEFDASSKMTIAPTTFMSGYKYELIITDMNGNYEYGIREVGKKSIVEDACIELFME